MRLMLGTPGNPSLLVNIGQEYSPTHFEFRVINGAWDGTFNNGHVTVWHPDNPWSNLSKTDILCDTQDRLCSYPHYEYESVFANFHNPNYVGRKPKEVVLPAYWDDDIAF